MASIEQEISRRRTFAIISHPDAGKTTLTEKFLLYGGAVQLAGSVTARKNQRATTSDWMELERQRGISVSSTVLQFEYRGFCVNLLDTPGHKDFSEDTYRVLTAVDAAVMVIDAGKGIETQTRKLFEVCRQRGIPIFTFMNKLDRPAKDPLDLLDELERVLGIAAYPVNWPLGNGTEFRGVFDRQTKQVHFFERVPSGAYRAPVSVHDLADADRARDEWRTTFTRRSSRNWRCSKAQARRFDHDAVLAGKLTPVFLRQRREQLRRATAARCLSRSRPAAASRAIVDERVIDPVSDGFSGFIFKIQANMDPRHRDRLAFVRICSGKFERDMSVIHTRTGKKLRLSSSHKLFGRERETVDEAYPGDVVGLVGTFRFSHRRHARGRCLDCLRRDSALHARVFRLAAKPEHRAVQTLPRRSRTTACRKAWCSRF